MAKSVTFQVRRDGNGWRWSCTTCGTTSDVAAPGGVLAEDAAWSAFTRRMQRHAQSHDDGGM